MPRREVIDQDFFEDLKAAQLCSQRALNALYDPNGPKRSFWYRTLLGRAQSILIGLYTQELARKARDQE